MAGSANNIRVSSNSKSHELTISEGTPRRAERAISISAASAIVGVEVHTLRYWEREFQEFLQPLRTEGGQRRYTQIDMKTLFLIKRLLRDEMFSIAGARKHLFQLAERSKAS